jgi:magnesium transporter
MDNKPPSGTVSPPSQYISGFYRSSDGAITPVEGEDDDLIRRAIADKGGLLWVNLVTSSPERTRVLSEIFQFHPLTIEDAVSVQVDPAKIDPFPDYIFIVVQAIAGYISGQQIRPVEVEFYLGTNFVVSCHREDVPRIEEFRNRCERDTHILEHSPDWLLYGLLDTLVDDYLPVVDELDETIDRLEEAVLENGSKDLLQKILLVKRNTMRLRRITAPQREILNRLSRNEFPALIRAENAIYFRDIYDHLVRVDYLIEALRDLADGALQTYLSVISNRLNEVMKVLTAAATLFLPLTVITGVYGMNFEHNVFPSFESTWGFIAVIAVMFINSVVMLTYFRIRRWI